MGMGIVTFTCVHARVWVWNSEEVDNNIVLYVKLSAGLINKRLYIVGTLQHAYHNTMIIASYST